MNNQPYSARYQCISGCPTTHPLTEVIYRCPTCGDLLEVQHDLKALRRLSPQAWKDLFRSRNISAAGTYTSGIWSKKEWVCPAIEDAHIITIGEGRTPLFSAQKLARQTGVDVRIKLCGNSHTGSFKDLGMTVLVSMVNQMIANGRNIKAVACASTGDTSAALAAYCAAAGIPALVLLPRDKVSNAQLIQPIANGALTLSLDTDFDGCMEIVQELTESTEIYLANSMNSLRIEGQKTVGFEIMEQLEWNVPEWIIVPGGNLGNVSAIGKGLLEMHSAGLIDCLPRLVCAQTEQANPLFESFKNGFETFRPKKAGPTLATAIQIGNPVSFRKAIRVLEQLNGIVEQASENDLANASALADREGLFVCPQTGVGLAVFLKLLEAGEIRPKERVMIISTAHGLKFVDFKINYHESQLKDVNSRFANLPVELPADVEVVREKLRTFVTQKEQ